MFLSFEVHVTITRTPGSWALPLRVCTFKEHLTPKHPHPECPWREPEPVSLGLTGVIPGSPQRLDDPPSEICTMRTLLAKKRSFRGRACFMSQSWQEGPWSNGSIQSKLAAFYLNLCSCSSMMLDVLASCCMLLNKSQPVPSGCPWEKTGRPWACVRMIGDGRLALFGNGTWSTKLGSKVPKGDVFAWHWLPIIPDFSFCLKDTPINYRAHGGLDAYGHRQNYGKK